MQTLISSEKRTLDHCATVQLFFSLAQVRCFWRCFCFRSSLVALFLKMSERGDSWCTDSVHSLWNSPKCLNQLYLTVFSSLRSSLLWLLVHILLPNFCLPVNFAFNMLWYSHPFQLWPSVTYPLCGGCQCSSSGSLPSQQCPPLLWFQRTRDTQNLYCMDGHFLKLKCKYSNILR